MPRARLSFFAPSLVQRMLPLVACALLLSAGRATRLDAQDTTKTAPPVPAPASTPAPAPQDSVRTAPQDTAKHIAPPDTAKHVAPQDSANHVAPLDSVKKLAAAPSDSSAKSAPVAASTEPTVTPAGAPAAAPATATPAAATATPAAATAAPAVTPSSAINVPMPVVTAPPPVDTLPDANAHVQAASRMLEQGKVGAAVGELLQGVREDPTDIDTWVSLGDIYRQTGKTKLALDTYAKGLNVVSGAADALRVPYAELLYRNKKKDQAIEVLKKGIELDPDVSADMKSLLGRIIIDDMTVGDQGDEVASDAAEPSTTEKSGKTTAAAATKKKPATPKISVKKKKRLCKLFCPEDLKVPKP